MNLKIMSDWDAMRLADVLTIAEAACCIVGVPTTRLGSNKMTSPYLDGNPTENGNGAENCEAVFRRVVEALLNSIKAKKLQPAKIYPGKSHGIRTVDAVSGGRWDPVEDIDAWSTLVEVDVLKAWLESRNVRPPFFYSEKSGEPDYLDPNHARYSGKLAASVRAWQAMEDENLRRSKSPLSAMTEWLGTRYEEFGLIHRQDNIKSGYKLGQRNDGAIQQAAKTANWQPEGGATKTPTTVKRPPLSAVAPPPREPSWLFSLTDCFRLVRSLGTCSTPPWRGEGGTSFLKRTTCSVAISIDKVRAFTSQEGSQCHPVPPNLIRLSSRRQSMPTA